MQSILPILVHFTFQNAKNELSIQYLFELTITLATEQAGTQARHLLMPEWGVQKIDKLAGSVQN